MPQIETLSARTIDAVVQRVVAHQRAVNERQPLINGAVDAWSVKEMLLDQRDDVAVALRDDVVVGHLRGTVLLADPDGPSVWVSPDSMSYDDSATLDALYAFQATNWLDRGAVRQFVWSPIDETAPWINLGFAYVHQRGVLALDGVVASSLPTGYVTRRGTRDDLEVALVLDAVMDDEQRSSPSFLLTLGDARGEWIETLEDPDTVYLIVERDGDAVGQCVWFPLDQRVGSFQRTVHLSAVTVLSEHRRLGVARAMIDEALLIARAAQFAYAETNWRVSNRRAARYWDSYGFTSTYTRLHRVIGAG